MVWQKRNEVNSSSPRTKKRGVVKENYGKETGWSETPG